MPVLTGGALSSLMQGRHMERGELSSSLQLGLKITRKEIFPQIGLQGQRGREREGERVLLPRIFGLCLLHNTALLDGV